MKHIILSMQPFWKEIIWVVKRYTYYWSRFLNREILAYVRVSALMYGISGILYLGKKIYLSDWRENYRWKSETIWLEEYNCKRR